MKYYNYPQPRGTEVAVDLDSINVNEYVGGGSGGGAFIVNCVEGERDGQPVMVCDKTFKEIKSAMLEGKCVIFAMLYETEEWHCNVSYIQVSWDDPEFTVYKAYVGPSYEFSCLDENDYPVNWGAH